jgi:hypothetical protein
MPSFAGLWERWDKGEAPIETFTILTGEPNSLTAELHDRMPVILDPADYDGWLSASNTAGPQALLQPFSGPVDGRLPDQHQSQQREERYAGRHRTAVDPWRVSPMPRSELPPGAKRKLIEFDAETWQALHAGARPHEHDAGTRR